MDELISRQAAIDAIESTDWYHQNRNGEIVHGANSREEQAWYKADEVHAVIENLPSAQPELRWIPVKIRPMTEEERQEWIESLDYDIDIEYEDAVIFDCPMPADGQEILVSYRKWINMDKCEIIGGYYALEGMGNWGDVTAWMPLPEPYVKEGESDERT